VLNNEATRTGLEAQLKTLDRRIRVLDLLSIPGRQRKSLVDVNELVELLHDIHRAKIDRHGIDFTVIKSARSFKVRVERGQILQILDNLFSNAFYWLRHRFDRRSRPSVRIEVDSDNSAIVFSDNGPGVPADMATDIFKPFVTTKPPGEGRGLGLFISQRLAEYNDATLDLAPAGEDRIHRAFILSLKSARQS
jgi:C4-dicarboxylate-specific signal transduction histidine kinase